MSDDWHEFNDRYLGAALARVRALLERTMATASTGEEATGEMLDALPEAVEAPLIPDLPEITTDAPPALAELATLFDLTPFERDILALAVARELDPSFGGLCATVQGAADQDHPTFAVALAVLPDSHWSAISPQGPLRQWRLIGLGEGKVLTAAPLFVEERILHYLRGLEASEDRLAGLVTRLGRAATLVASQRAVAERLATLWTRGGGDGSQPIVQLVGEDIEGKRSVAAAAAAALGIEVAVLDAMALPTGAAELDGLTRLLDREAALGRRVLYLDSESVAPADEARRRAISTFAEQYRSVLLVASRERRLLPRRTSLPLEVAKPETAEQRQLWRSVLGAAAARLDGRIDSLAAQFDLTAEAIRAASIEALGQTAEEAEPDPDELARALWHSAIGQSRPALDALAQRIRSLADWDDLVLPPAQKELLREIAVHVRQRHRVYEEWGFASRSSRGLGISALLAGPSGTGKTMAAEVLAGELDLDLYRVDLATVVSKYIGETEKNLKQIFDAAELGGAILLFDEADALFGKRSEVKDSHDRYANVEVSYLLQRMEEYRGLAILTTNLKHALDPAFLRRIRFVVGFPFPDAAARAEIWRRVFPPQTPTEGLDAEKLARLGVAGGNIKNIAVSAAFLAAENDTPVRMEHLLRAARGEYGKIEKPLTAREIAEWDA